MATMQVSVLLGVGRVAVEERSVPEPAADKVLVEVGFDVQDRELMLTVAFRYANTWPTAIQLVASGRVDLDSPVTGHYGLHDVEAALTASHIDPTNVKVIVSPAD